MSWRRVPPVTTPAKHIIFLVTRVDAKSIKDVFANVPDDAVLTEMTKDVQEGSFRFEFEELP